MNTAAGIQAAVISYEGLRGFFCHMDLMHYR